MQENAQVTTTASTSNVVRKFPKPETKKNLSTLMLSLGVVILGVLTGWLMSGGRVGSGDQSAGTEAGMIANDKEAGAKDESQFSTTAEGKLVEGGKKGEGTHYLERPGGESQNAYLTSTSLDLSTFVGKKVKVWGETISSVNAGWLIDVGKIRQID